MTPNILIAVGNGGPAFVKPYKDVANEIGPTMVVNDRSITAELVNEADIVFVEWADDLAVQLSKIVKPPKRLIIRCHSYEVFGPWLGLIQWQNVSDLVFVARHVKQAAKLAVFESIHKSEDMLGFNMKRLTTHVIPNCVDPALYQVADVEKNWGKVAFLGSINHKKGIPLLLQAMRRIVDKWPDWTLDIAGEIQDPRFSVYLDHMVPLLGLSKNVRYIGRLEPDAVPGWLSNHSHIISTSPWEGHPVNIIEGMMSGLIPLIHEWPGSADLYPLAYLWSAVGELPDIIETLGPAKHGRAIATERWANSVIYPKIKELFAPSVDGKIDLSMG